MSYSKRRAAEQIWLRVTGGNATPEADVLLADIHSFLPAAINASIGEDLKERRLLAIRERKPSNYKLNDILLIQGFTPTLDTARDLYKIDLPFIIPSYGGTFPINVMPQDGANSFVFFSSRSQLQGIETMLGEVAYTWLERSAIGQTLYFNNLVCNNCTVIVESACDYDALGLDVPLPVPDDLWERIFLRSENHFIQQRSTPSDETVNGTDETK